MFAIGPLLMSGFEVRIRLIGRGHRFGPQSQAPSQLASQKERGIEEEGTKMATMNMTTDTFLRPIEKPKGFMMKLAYYFTRQQFGKVLTPLKVHSARLPAAFGLFYTKIGKLDKKLVLPPETVMLIREQVARINVRYSSSASNLAWFIDALIVLFVQRRGTRGAGLCDGANEREKGQSGDFSANVALLLRTADLRDCVAGGERAPLQHDQHRFEHSFGHAVRYQQAAEVGRSVIVLARTSTKTSDVVARKPSKKILTAQMANGAGVW